MIVFEILMTDSLISAPAVDSSIIGVSCAGYETTVIIPEMKISFDFGRYLPQLHGCHIHCITHGHTDHIADLPKFCRIHELVCGSGKKHTVLCPEIIAEPLKEVLSKYHQMDTGELRPNPHEKWLEIHPVTEGTCFTVKNYSIRAFRTDHRVPSLGYCVYTKKSILKKELLGLPSKEIARLKHEGHQICDETVVCAVAFTGDTTIEGIIRHPDMLQAKVLIMECTYLEPETVKLAHERTHVHLSDIVTHADKFKNKRIILIHFSDRYITREIIKCIADSALPDDFKSRISIMPNDCGEDTSTSSTPSAVATPFTASAE